MEGLRALDSVAYVRFASVYRNFREARDFNALIDELCWRRGSCQRGRAIRVSSAESAFAEPGMNESSDDARFMAAALALGRRGLGLCAPNPAVGALLVKEGRHFGAWLTTKPGGRPHAETEALREAGERAAGATLYVTLEPCSHHGVDAAMHRRDHRFRRGARRLHDG